MEDKGTTRKIHSLIDKIYHPTNLFKAWESVRENKGSGGIDKVSIHDYEKVLYKELDILHQQLKENTYKPMPVKRVNIPKRNKPKEKRPSRNTFNS